MREGDIAKLPRGRAVLAAAGHDAVIVKLPDIAGDSTWGEDVVEGSRIYASYLDNLSHAATARQRDVWRSKDAAWMRSGPPHTEVL